MNERMMKAVHSSLMDADLILYFVDIDDRRQDEFAISLFQECKKPVFLAINKIDKYIKSKVLEKIDFFKDLFPFSEIIPLSALKGTNMELIEELIYQYLPVNDYFYPDEEYTMQTEKFYVSEQIREKILGNTKAEIPFTTMVMVEEIKKREKNIYIRAEIYVETRSQKKILVGKQGRFIKKIGELARKDLEDYFDKKIYLDLFIKIVPNWRNSQHILGQLEDNIG
jgi:GTP-binding protein Era